MPRAHNTLPLIMLIIMISWSLVREKQALLVCVLHLNLHVDLNVECGIYSSHKKIREELPGACLKFLHSMYISLETYSILEVPVPHVHCMDFVICLF